MPFVLDASVAISWGFEDEVTPYTDRVLGRLYRETALVPSIWPLEVANGALMGERRKRTSEADTGGLVDLLDRLPIKIDGQSLQRVMGPILGLARLHNLSTYDASYLELAVRERLPLATQDDRLRWAAEQAGVSVVP